VTGFDSEVKMILKDDDESRNWFHESIQVMEQVWFGSLYLFFFFSNKGSQRVLLIVSQNSILSCLTPSTSC